MLLQARPSTCLGTIDDTYTPPGISMLLQAYLCSSRHATRRHALRGAPMRCTPIRHVHEKYAYERDPKMNLQRRHEDSEISGLRPARRRKVRGSPITGPLTSSAIKPMRRGPARAYQFGQTIIVEDEDGEVIKKYDLANAPKRWYPSPCLSCLVWRFFMPTVFQLQYQTLPSWKLAFPFSSTCPGWLAVNQRDLTDCLVPATRLDAVRVRRAPMIIAQIAERVRSQSRRYCVASVGTEGFPSDVHSNT
jgi:hypothetical protein